MFVVHIAPQKMTFELSQSKEDITFRSLKNSSRILPFCSHTWLSNFSYGGPGWGLNVYGSEISPRMLFWLSHARLAYVSKCQESSYCAEHFDK